MLRTFVLLLFSLSSAFAGSALAATQRVGDWTVDISSSYTEAFTGNASSSTFGLICLRGACSFYLDSGSSCDEGATIPMLINANSGSAYVLASCVHLRSQQRIRNVAVIHDKDVVTAISSGTIIGFAIPLKSGEFKVVRFSLDGATEATEEAVAGMKAQLKAGNAGLRDQTM